MQAALLRSTDAWAPSFGGSNTVANLTPDHPSRGVGRATTSEVMRPGRKLVLFPIFRFARPYERIRGKRVGEPSANVLIFCRKRCPSGPTRLLYIAAANWPKSSGTASASERRRPLEITILDSVRHAVDPADRAPDAHSAQIQAELRSISSALSRMRPLSRFAAFSSSRASNSSMARRPISL